MKLSYLKQLLITAAVSMSLTAAVQAADAIKIGSVAPKSGPLAGGATVTQWPNLELWSKQVNADGGIKVGDKKMMVETYQSGSAISDARQSRLHHGTLRNRL